MDFGENCMLESNSRSTTPLGIRSIFDFNNEYISSVPDFSLIDDFGRESLGIMNLDNLDAGRESLWFSSGKASDFIGVDLPERAACDLNTAFMSCKDSLCESISPYMSLLNISNLKSGFINKFDLSTELEKKFSLSPPLNEKLNNLSSVSPLLKDIISVENRYKEKSFLKSPLKNSSFMINESSDGFNDSVFIEANHLAARFEDGSIYDLDVCENDMLDSIQEPKDLVDLSDDNIESVVPEKEAIFKMIDKILPKDQDLPLSVSTKENQCDTENKSKSIIKDKNPRDILSTLSELLNSDTVMSEKQKCEAQIMISNLAAILMPYANNFEDSGHSSIETELTSPSPECYEVLDLRKKSLVSDKQKSEEISVPLDLSLKSNRTVNCDNKSPKSLPPEYSSHPQSLIKQNSNNNSHLTRHSENKISHDVKNKFKLKKTEDNSNSKKGPMRAVVPLDNMAKRKSITSRLQMTPKRSEFQSDLKKTSTPLLNGLKPVAQSTPGDTVSSVNKLSSAGPRVVKQKLSYSRSSLHNVNRDVKNKNSSLTRRYSVDDLKKAQENEKVLSRSSSLGGKNGLIVGGNKPTSIAKLSSRLNARSLPVLKENRSKSVTRSSFGRKTGKENLY